MIFVRPSAISGRDSDVGRHARMVVADRSGRRDREQRDRRTGAETMPPTGINRCLADGNCGYGRILERGPFTVDARDRDARELRAHAAALGPDCDAFLSSS